LRNPATDIVADNARIVDRELVEQPDNPLGMPSHRHIAPSGSVAATVAEEIDDDDAVAFGNEWNDLCPEVRGRRKAVNEDDRLAGPTTSGSVVVQPSAVYVDKLTPHEVKRGEEQDCDHTKASLRRSSARGKMLGAPAHHKRRTVKGMPDVAPMVRSGTL
jgi:hypothetical protein